jgi:hypothetical protein
MEEEGGGTVRIAAAAPTVEGRRTGSSGNSVVTSERPPSSSPETTVATKRPRPLLDRSTTAALDRPAASSADGRRRAEVFDEWWPRFNSRSLASRLSFEDSHCFKVLPAR